MFAYDKTFDSEVVLGHCDLISWLIDFALYLYTQLLYFHTFYTPPLKKSAGYYVIPSKKICVRVSVRPSVCLSVHLSVCPSVRQRFVSGLYLEHSLTDFLQTLYRSSYQEGVVWD